MDKQKELDEKELQKLVFDQNVDFKDEIELAYEMREAIENGDDYYHKKE